MKLSEMFPFPANWSPEHTDWTLFSLGTNTDGLRLVLIQSGSRSIDCTAPNQQHSKQQQILEVDQLAHCCVLVTKGVCRFLSDTLFSFGYS